MRKNPASKLPIKPAVKDSSRAVERYARQEGDRLSLSAYAERRARSLGNRFNREDDAIGGGVVASASVFSPLQLSPVVWWKFNTGITQAAGVCSRWEDQSGNGNPALQPVVANRPAVAQDGSLVFNGASSFIKAFPLTAPLPVPYSFYIAFKQSAWVLNGGIVAGGVAVNSTLTSITQAGATPGIQYDNSTTFVNLKTIGLGDKAIAAVTIKGADSIFQLVNVTTGNPASRQGAQTFGTNGFTLGSFFSGAINWSRMTAYEFIAYPTAHDDATRAQVIAYLTTLLAGVT